MKKFINKNKLFILCIGVTAILYLAFSRHITGNIFASSWFPYYNYLLDAFFHGRFNVFSPATADLSFFAGKWYLNWGPAPVLLIIPLYLVFGLSSSDIFYTLIIGIVNVIIFGFIIDEFKKYFLLNISRFSKFIILISFAFASPNFYLSLAGRIWHTEQIIATFYLLLFILFYFKFLNNIHKTFFLFLSLLFYNFAWFSRATLIFYGVLFLYPLISLLLNKNKQLFKKYIFLIGCAIGLFIIAYASYDYVRFHNPFETGLSYYNGNLKFQKVIAEHKLFSLSYFIYNLKFYFLNFPSFSFRQPFIKIDVEGNSVFFMYPLLLTNVLLFQKNILINTKKSVFLLVAFIVIALGLFLLLLYSSTGWAQLGNRYVLDVIPLLFLLPLFVIEDMPHFAQLLILICGVFVNMLGALTFYSIYPY